VDLDDTGVGVKWVTRVLHARAAHCPRREYSKAYIAAEDAAHAARKGIWDGTFQYPADWRKAERAKGSNSKEVQGLPRAFPAPMDMPAAYVPPPPPPQVTTPQIGPPGTLTIWCKACLVRRPNLQPMSCFCCSPCTSKQPSSVLLFRAGG